MSTAFLSGCHSSGDPDPEPEIPENEKMVLLFATPEDNLSVKLPLSGTVDCLIDWGDGTTEHFDRSHPVHTYERSGAYLVTISGTVTAMNATPFTDQERSYLQRVQRWGKQDWRI